MAPPVVCSSLFSLAASSVIIHHGQLGREVKESRVCFCAGGRWEVSF